MSKSINIFQKAALAVFALVLAAGCVFEKEGPSMDAKDVMVMLDISAGDMKTKAYVRDETTINTIRIFAFDQSGNTVGHVYKENPAADEKFHMVLSVPGGQESIEVDFYAVANENAMYYDGSFISLTENISLGELNELIYNSLVTSRADLPLYGKLEDKMLALTSGAAHIVDGHIGFLLTESVSVVLSSSLAKIGVFAAAKEGASTNPIIHSVTLKSPGRRNLSYLFPADDETALKARDADISSLSVDRVFDMVADNVDMLANDGVVEKRLVAQNTDADAVVTNYYTEIVTPFYLAEVPYGSNDWTVAADPAERPVVLVVEYSFGDGTVRKYAEVNMPPIERNTYYQVRCLIKTDGQILVNVSVAPWVEGEDHVLDFDFPTHNDLLYKTGSVDAEGNYVHTYGTEATAYYKDGSEEGAFSVDFSMSYPLGGRWQPLINDAANTIFDLRLYKRGSDEEITEKKVVVTDETKDSWYTIKVVPLASEYVGKKVTLSISYTNLYLGHDYSYLLQVNGGEENNLAWTEFNPVAEDEYEASTVDIVITQVDQN